MMIAPAFLRIPPTRRIFRIPAFPQFKKARFQSWLRLIGICSSGRQLWRPYGGRDANAQAVIAPADGFVNTDPKQALSSLQRAGIHRQPPHDLRGGWMVSVSVR